MIISDNKIFLSPILMSSGPSFSKENPLSGSSNWLEESPKSKIIILNFIFFSSSDKIDFTNWSISLKQPLIKLNLLEYFSLSSWANILEIGSLSIAINLFILQELRINLE